MAHSPDTAGGGTQPHRGPLCSGPDRRMTLFCLFPPAPTPKRNGKTKREQEINSYYYYNTIFFLRKLLHPEEGSETMLPARVTTTPCVCRVSSEPACAADSPSPASTQPSRKRLHLTRLSLVGKETFPLSRIHSCFCRKYR